MVAITLGVSCSLDSCDMICRGVETSQKLVLLLMAVAKNEQKDTLKLFTINDVYDKVDR